MPVLYTFPLLPSSSSLLHGISNRGTSIILHPPEVQISCFLVARSDPGEFDGFSCSLRRRRLNAGGAHVFDNAPSRTSSLAASTSTIEIPVTCYQVLSKSLLRLSGILVEVAVRVSQCWETIDLAKLILLLSMELNLVAYRSFWKSWERRGR